MLKSITASVSGLSTFTRPLVETVECVKSKRPNKLTSASLIETSCVLPIVPTIKSIALSVSQFLMSTLKSLPLNDHNLLTQLLCRNDECWNNNSHHTFKFASATIFPILLNVWLLTTALFVVIPSVSSNCKAIVPVVGSVALSDCNEKLIWEVETTFNELEGSALWKILPFVTAQKLPTTVKFQLIRAHPNWLVPPTVKWKPNTGLAPTPIRALVALPTLVSAVFVFCNSISVPILGLLAFKQLNVRFLNSKTPWPPLTLNEEVLWPELLCMSIPVVGTCISPVELVKSRLLITSKSVATLAWLKLDTPPTFKKYDELYWTPKIITCIMYNHFST